MKNLLLFVTCILSFSAAAFAADDFYDNNTITQFRWDYDLGMMDRGDYGWNDFNPSPVSSGDATFKWPYREFDLWSIGRRCEGLCGEVSFNEGADQSSSLGLQFDFEPGDLSKLEGLCVAYKSDKIAPMIEVVSEQDIYQYPLEISSRGQVVEIPWSSFKNLNGFKIEDVSVALASVSSIRFAFYNGGESSSELGLYEVGSIGNCDGYYAEYAPEVKIFDETQNDFSCENEYAYYYIASRDLFLQCEDGSLDVVVERLHWDGANEVGGTWFGLDYTSGRIVHLPIESVWSDWATMKEFADVKHCEGFCGKITWNGEEYAEVGYELPLLNPKDYSSEPKDFTSLNGLCFTYKATEVAPIVRLETSNGSYSTMLPLQSEATVVELPWSAFDIEDNSSLSALKSIRFVFFGESGQSTEYGLYELGSVGECDGANPPQIDIVQNIPKGECEPGSVAYFDVESYESTYYCEDGAWRRDQNGIVTSMYWTGKSNDLEVSFTIDNNYDASHFYQFNDAEYGYENAEWLSRFMWAKTWDIDNLDLNVVETCEGLCGKASISTETNEPIVAVGFNVGYDDLNSLEGLCATYKSDAIAPSLEFVSANGVTYRAILETSSGATTVNVPWSSFRALDGSEIQNAELILSSVKDIHFAFRDARGESGNFGIYEMGSIGECQGFENGYQPPEIQFYEELPTGECSERTKAFVKEAKTYVDEWGDIYDYETISVYGCVNGKWEDPASIVDLYWNAIDGGNVTHAANGNDWFKLPWNNIDATAYRFPARTEKNAVEKCQGMCGELEMEPDGVFEYVFNGGFDGDGSNVSALQGVCATYKSSGIAPIVQLTTADGNSYSTLLDVSADVRTVDVPWSSFDITEEALSSVTSIKFGFLAPTEETQFTEFGFYELGSLGSCGNIEPPVVKIFEMELSEEDCEPGSIGYIASSSETYTCSEDGKWDLADKPAAPFLWSGLNHDYKVETGFEDDGSGTAGIWYTYSGEESSFTWPVNDFEENFEELVDECNGICGQADVTAYGWAGLYFNISGNKELGHDVSSWDGLCITYRSSDQLKIAIAPEDAENLTGHDDHVVWLPSSNGVRTLNLEWDMFSQSDWGEYLDLGEMLTKAAMIKLQYDGESYPNFEIYEVGSYGACEGVSEKDSYPKSTGLYWNGKYGSAQVETNVEDANGWWYAYNENAAAIHWPVDPDEYESLSPIVQECDGLCGSIEATEDDWGTGIGFDLSVNYDYGHSVLPVNVSAWRGVCIAYESPSLAPYVMLRGKGDVGHYRAPLAKASKKVTVDLSWEDFLMDENFSYDGSTEDFLKQVQAVAVEWYTENKAVSADFVIYEIGAYGTCEESDVSESSSSTENDESSSSEDVSSSSVTPESSSDEAPSSSSETPSSSSITPESSSSVTPGSSSGEKPSSSSETPSSSSVTPTSSSSVTPGSSSGEKPSSSSETPSSSSVTPASSSSVTPGSSSGEKPSSSSESSSSSSVTPESSSSVTPGSSSGEKPSSSSETPSSSSITPESSSSVTPGSSSGEKPSSSSVAPSSSSITPESSSSVTPGSSSGEKPSSSSETQSSSSIMPEIVDVVVDSALLNQHVIAGEFIQPVCFAYKNDIDLNISDLPSGISMKVSEGKLCVQGSVHKLTEPGTYSYSAVIGSKIVVGNIIVASEANSVSPTSINNGPILLTLHNRTLSIVGVSSAMVEIFDMKGSPVHSAQSVAGQVSLEALKPGSYIVRARSGTSNVIRRISLK